VYLVPWDGVKNCSESPTNISELNTEFNDYNISAPTIYSEKLFHFSSDRKSLGTDFDIVGENISFEWSKGNGTFQCYSSESNYSEVISEVTQIVNTSRNELGPFSLFYMSEDHSLSFLMFFSRQTNDILDNFFIRAIQSGNQKWNVDSVTSCKSINSNANDGYVTILGTGLKNQSYGYGNSLSAFQKAIFCSDKAGNFDIYEITITQNANALLYLAEEKSGLDEKITILSSSSDDKCPYVNSDVIVFASNRQGGFGGI
jgi:hypothetical protein